MQSLACQCGLFLRTLMLEEELHRYQSLAKYLSNKLCAAALIGEDGRILQCNKAFEKLTGFGDSLPPILMRAMGETEKQTIDIGGVRFWFKCHRLTGGCRLLLLDRRAMDTPCWKRIGWSSLLSHREREICQLVLEGLENEDIAERLHLSYHTIKNHCRHIHEKLGVNNRVELVLALLGAGGNGQVTN